VTCSVTCRLWRSIGWLLRRLGFCSRGCSIIGSDEERRDWIPQDLNRRLSDFYEASGTLCEPLLFNYGDDQKIVVERTTVLCFKRWYSVNVS
jgi:hypothetical protein